MQPIKICHHDVAYSSGKTFKHLKFTMKFKFGIITVMEDFLNAKLTCDFCEHFGSHMNQTRVSNYEFCKQTPQLLANIDQVITYHDRSCPKNTQKDLD